MKVIILHGDHIKDSYDRLAKFIDVAKKRGWKIERISGKESRSIPELLRSNTLFEQERLFILQDPTKAGKKDLEWMKDNAKDLPGNLVVFNEGFLGKRDLSKLPKADKTEVFKYPKLIYKFLESLYPGNQQSLFKLLYSLKEQYEPEYLFAILASHFRDVYTAKVDSGALGYPSWREKKLVKQAERFTETKLKQVIAAFAEADYLSKTTSKSLYSLLDLIIATKLE